MGLWEKSNLGFHNPSPWIIHSSSHHVDVDDGGGVVKLPSRFKLQPPNFVFSFSNFSKKPVRALKALTWYCKARI